MGIYTESIKVSAAATEAYLAAGHSMSLLPAKEGMSIYRSGCDHEAHQTGSAHGYAECPGDWDCTWKPCTRWSRTTSSETMGLGNWLCACARVYVCAPAAELELWPQGLVCPCASNWKDWDPGAAAQQTECLSLTAGGIHMVYLCKYISQKRIFTSPSGEPERKQNVWMMWATWLAMCASIYALYYVCFCVPVACVRHTHSTSLHFGSWDVQMQKLHHHIRSDLQYPLFVFEK